MKNSNFDEAAYIKVWFWEKKTLGANVRQYLPTIVKDAIHFFIIQLKIVQESDQYKLPENLSETAISESAKSTET